MLKLSIIIPVYNVEKYIKRCILSVAKQDISQDFYEIIIVDDASPDNSIQIAREIVSNFDNIRIVSQENTGLGGARNKGLYEAKGEYVWFIDSDDFIANNCLKDLLGKLQNQNLDILAFDFACTNEEGKVIDWIDFKFDFDNKKTITGEEFYALNYRHSYIWLYLFKRSLFVDNEITFKKRINMQDSEILPKILVHVNNIAFYDRQIYFYVNREDSFINSKKSSTRLKYYNSVIKVNNYMSEFGDTLDKNNLIKITISKKLTEIKKILFQQYIYTDFDETQLKDILSNLKTNNLFPFKKFQEKNIKKRIVYTFLRIFINISPITMRKIYLKLK